MDDLNEILCMAPVDATTSYAANSNLQRNAIANGKAVLKQSVEELCSTMLPGAKQLVVADLGCSYGPNVFTVISEVMEAVGESCRSSPPEVQVLLNDLPANDFNDIFRSLASYKKQLKEEKGEELAGRLYVAGVPGSFYGRLFPSRSVHLFHSSSSIHWLSQVPEGLKDENNNELNKGHIHVGRRSPPGVHTAYLQQFQRDLSAFLGCRSEEIQDGGVMVLTTVVRSSSDPLSATSVLMTDLITEILKSMANEGIIKEVDIDAFNLPVYNPSMEELHAIIDDQGSFQIVEQSVVELSVGSDAIDQTRSSHVRGQSMAKLMRAAMEPLFLCHFGKESNIVDEIFTRLPSIFTREYEKGKEFNVPFYIFSLKRKNAP